jgi:hypothetical protein
MAHFIPETPEAAAAAWRHARVPKARTPAPRRSGPASFAGGAVLRIISRCARPRAAGGTRPERPLRVALRRIKERHDSPERSARRIMLRWHSMAAFQHPAILRRYFRQPALPEARE